MTNQSHGADAAVGHTTAMGLLPCEPGWVGSPKDMIDFPRLSLVSRMTTPSKSHEPLRGALFTQTIDRGHERWNKLPAAQDPIERRKVKVKVKRAR